MQTRYEFVETLFPYDPAEFGRWCSGEALTIDGLLDVCGPLGRTRGTYKNQALMGQNYPEVRYAVHLVESEGFASDGIIYENFTFSPRAVATLKGKTSLSGIGASKVAEVFSDRFFTEFGRLFDLNRTQIKKSCEKLIVDLFAASPAHKKCVICEVKKYDVGRLSTEMVQREQLLCLAFVRSIVERLGQDAFREAPYEVRTPLVAFNPNSASASAVRARRHVIDFAI